MTQRYDIDCHAVTMYKIDDGGYVKWDSVKDQLEWRELTEKDRPKDSIDVYIWLYPDPRPYIGCVSKGQVYQGHKYVCDLDDVGHDIKVKWKRIERFPWENKQ